MKISYVIIVLNGMPFLEFSLKAIYPSAHEIIVVEGGVTACMFAANSDGSSKDGTVEFVQSFPDPEKKIRFIQGRWSEKCEMQNEALKHISGDYVWLIDSDEVYREEDIQVVIQMLEQDSTITQVDFFNYSFWKGFNYFIDSSILLTSPYGFRRLFKFAPGAKFSTHRPPTLVLPKGFADKQHIVSGHQMMNKGVRFCHYSFVLESQVFEKTEYHRRRGPSAVFGLDRTEWYNECFLKWTPKNRKEIEQKYPVWMGDKNSTSKLFEGEHPKVITDFIERFSKNYE
jgi:glycosyltransferase involved in cell wall biosynthesis